QAGRPFPPVALPLAAPGAPIAGPFPVPAGPLSAAAAVEPGLAPVFPGGLVLQIRRRGRCAEHGRGGPPFLSAETPGAELVSFPGREAHHSTEGAAGQSKALGILSTRFQRFGKKR